MPRLIERVVLVGFMGAGKSTVGPLVARSLAWDFLDMDGRIEERLGLSVAECFRTRGEAAFRQEELAVARGLGDRLVVAAGGGAFAQTETRQVLQHNALTVWLRAPLEVLLSRLPKDGARPLASNRAIMQALLAEREPAYREADLTIDTSDADVSAVVDRVVQAIRARSRGAWSR